MTSRPSGFRGPGQGLPASFARARAGQIRGAVQEAFLQHYASFGCAQARPATITSGVDPSVIFVGSAISVLKPFIFERRIPARGIALAQPSLRTHNASRLLEPGFDPQYGGLFTNVALVAPVQVATELCVHSVNFLLDIMGFGAGDARLRVSASDPDLLTMARQAARGLMVEIDTLPMSSYRHSMGAEGVHGRNINFALRHAQRDEYRDIGNLIIFEGESGTFVEVGFGDTNLMLTRYNLEHVLDCFPFPPLGLRSARERRLFEDVVAISVALWREGLRPSSRTSGTKILGKYFRTLYFLRAHLGIAEAVLLDFIRKYEEASYGDMSLAGEEMVSFLSAKGSHIEAQLRRLALPESVRSRIEEVL
jgi:hypothetical protein